MMKLVDVPDSKSGVLRDVWVRAPLSALKMKNKDLILSKLSILFIVFCLLVGIRMYYKIYQEMTPEGRYENYKWYISESAELWSKNRDNQFINKQNVISWYETPDKKGRKPMDIFPEIIYSKIKEAANLTFDKYVNISSPDSVKKIISEYIENQREKIIESLKKEL